MPENASAAVFACGHEGRLVGRRVDEEHVGLAARAHGHGLAGAHRQHLDGDIGSRLREQREHDVVDEPGVLEARGRGDDELAAFHRVTGATPGERQKQHREPDGSRCRGGEAETRRRTTGLSS